MSTSAMFQNVQRSFSVVPPYPKGPREPKEGPKTKKTKGPPRPRSAKKFKKRPESDDDSISETHEVNGEGTCDVCDRVYDTKETSLRYQLKDHHGCFEKIQCTHCDMTFLDPPTFKTHILKRHFLGSTDEGHFQCPWCLQFFQSKWSLQNHHNKGHSKTKGQQEEAEEGQSPDPNVLNIHCFVCKDTRRYSSAEELAEHEMTSKHQATLRSKVSVYCNVCKVNFKGSTEALQAHLTSPEHLKEAEALKNVDLLTFCVPCKKSFEGSSALLKHTRNLAHSRVCAFRQNEEVTEKAAMEVAEDKEVPLEVPAQCPSCPRTFDLQSALESHILKYHDPSGYSCQFCPAKFTHLLDSTKHRATHPKEIPKAHMCDQCGETFETKTSLGIHFHHRHKDKKPRPNDFVCDSCGKAYTSRYNLDNHALNCKNAPDSFPCPHCAASFKTLKRLRRHMYLLHYSEFLEHTPHSCPICCLVYPSSIDLTFHMTFRHGNLTCDTCGKRFLMTAHLNAHQRVHTGEQPFECSVCSKRFSNESNMKLHKKIHERGTRSRRGRREFGPPPASFSCTSCGETFLARHLLDKHAVQCAAAPSSVHCAYCTKATFKTPQRLRQHVHRSHYAEFLTETPHSCPLCYVILPSTEELTSHMTSSHGNLTCDTCGKEFLAKTHLNNHKRIHTGERPFACTVCPKKFNLKINLTEHMMRHTGQKPQQCSQCDASFWRKKHLEKHVQEIHS